MIWSTTDWFVLLTVEWKCKTSTNSRVQISQFFIIFLDCPNWASLVTHRALGLYETPSSIYKTPLKLFVSIITIAFERKGRTCCSFGLSFIFFILQSIVHESSRDTVKHSLNAGGQGFAGQHYTIWLPKHLSPLTGIQQSNLQILIKCYCKYNIQIS